MSMRDLAREALRSLEANRGRSLLTILGIVIGIAAVIAMTSLIGGVRNGLISDMGLNAARTVYISCAEPLDEDDLVDLARRVPDYEAIEGTYDSYTQVQAGDKSISVSITGSSPRFLEMTGTLSKICAGRAFTEEEAASGARVTLISRAGVEAFFGSGAEDAVGESIKLNNISYTVIGVVDDGITGSDYCLAYMPGKAGSRISAMVGTITRRLWALRVRAPTSRPSSRKPKPNSPRSSASPTRTSRTASTCTRSNRPSTSSTRS